MRVPVVPRMLVLIALMAANGLVASQAASMDAATVQPGLLTSEFVFDKAPFQAAHASTIVETREGTLLAAWFAGTRERALDVGIWQSRYEDGKWSEPREI